MKKTFKAKNYVLCMMIVSVTMILLLANEAKADTYGFYNYTVNKTTKTVKIDSYTGDELEVTIPSKLGGYKVTTLGHASFRNKTFMQKVTIPSTVTTIEGYAFAENKALKTLVIPNSVKTLGYYMCGNCDALTSVTIGTGVREIPNGAFTKCDALTTVKLSEGLQKICGSAGYYGSFGECKALKGITIPSTVTEISGYAFNNCNSLEEVVIPNNVKILGGYVFSECKGLKKITIGTGITEIPNNFVASCTSLTDVVFKGNNVTRIGAFAFTGCKTLKEITLPAYVDVLAEFAFNGCSSLSSVKLNEGLMKIEGSVFANCTSLTEITIPSSVVEFSTQMFRGCKNLKTVILKANISTSKNNLFSSVGCPVGSIRVKAYSNNEFIKDVNIGGDYKYFTVEDVEAIPSTSLAFSKKSVTLALGKSVTLPATMAPANTTDSIHYVSGNKDIATVNQRGKIEAKWYGATTITARTNSGHLAQITVNVLPAKVNGLVDTARGVNSIKIRWNEQKDVDGYYIYRKVSGKWKRIAQVNSNSSNSTNTYLAKSLASGSTQIFAVNAYKVVNGATYMSPSFPTVTTLTKPAKVTNFKKAAASKTAIKTTWKKVSGANGYVVYRYSNKKWVKVATTKNNYYTYTKLAKNTSYKFCVKAYKKVGTKTEYGSTTTLTARTTK